MFKEISQHLEYVGMIVTQKRVPCAWRLWIWMTSSRWYRSFNLRHRSQVFFNLGPVEFPHELRAKMQLFTGELQKVRNSKIERVTVKMLGLFRGRQAAWVPEKWKARLCCRLMSSSMWSNHFKPWLRDKMHLKVTSLVWFGGELSYRSTNGICRFVRGGTFGVLGV